MPVKKKRSNKAVKRNGVPERHLRRGVCMMCGAHTNVSHIDEFDGQLLCDACREDTALLANYLQSGQNSSMTLDDDLLDDDEIF
jgi:hypothetical protein